MKRRAFLQSACGLMVPAWMASKPAAAFGIMASGARYFSSGGGGGAIADGDSYSFTGPSSTSNTTAKYFAGGLGGPIDAGTVDADASLSGWTLSGNYWPKFDTSQLLSRTRALGFEESYHWAANPENSASFGMSYDLGDGFAEMFFSGNVRFGCNTSANLTALQWKMFRLMPTASVVDTSPMIYAARWKDAGPQFIQVTPDGTFWVDGLGGFPNFNTDEWYHVEFWCQPESSASAGDGAWTMKWWRLSDGALVVDFSDSGVNNYDSATRMRWFTLQNYFGNAAPHVEGGSVDRVTDFTLGGDGYAYWDDIVLHSGADCRRRIVLGDASTFSACNKAKLVYQPFTTWTGTSRAIDVNKGLHSSLSTKYLYEIDNADAVVNSTGIALA